MNAKKTPSSKNVLQEVTKQTEAIIQKAFLSLTGFIDNEILEKNADSFLKGTTLHLTLFNNTFWVDYISSFGYIGTKLRQQIKNHYEKQGILFHTYHENGDVKIAITKNTQTSKVKTLILRILNFKF